MEERKTIFDYAGQVFLIFGFSVVILCVLTLLVGEDAKEVSTMFRLGNEGLTIATMGQFLLTSVLIVLWRVLFFTDMWIKKLSVSARAVGMVCCILLTIIVFILIFGWFPVNMWQPWVMFFACFAACFGVSTGVMALKERAENRRMAAALKRMQEE